MLNEAFGWTRQGLRARAITRDLAWGVPVPLPGWEDRRLYVWFDAVIGYLSASVEWSARSGRPEAWRKWWRDGDVRHRYFLGKDNAPFHAVWWPAILAGADPTLHLPDDLVVNHYLTSGSKMSASRGVGFTVAEGIERLGIDGLRHALCSLNPENADVEFSWEHAAELRRTGLLGAIANPVYRVTSLLWKRYGGRIDMHAWTDAVSERQAAATALESIGASLRDAELRAALALVHGVGTAVNRALAEQEPWRLPEEEGHGILTRLLPALDVLGLASWPIVPETAGRIRRILGREPMPRSWSLEERPPVIGKAPTPPLQPFL